MKISTRSKISYAVGEITLAVFAMSASVKIQITKVYGIKETKAPA
jgi:hypothetical protein